MGHSEQSLLIARNAELLIVVRDTVHWHVIFVCFGWLISARSRKWYTGERDSLHPFIDKKIEIEVVPVCPCHT